MESYLINLLSVNYAYQFDFIQSNRTENLGRMLAPLDIRYVVLNTEIVPAKAATVLQVLQHQKDLRFVRQQDFFFVFENLEYVSHVFSTSNAILVEGGRDVFSALTCIDSFNSSKTALIFLDEQTPWDASALNSSDTIILHDWHNLLPIVDPSDLQPISGQVLHENLYFPTYWSKAQASDIRFGVWTSTLVANHVPNWDFDFGQGFVFTDRPGAELTIPVNVKEDADYILFLRYLPSKVGGRFSLIEDGIKVNTIQTLSNSTRFSLSQIGPMHLAKGQHVFDLRNEMGFNAINYVMLIPLDKLSSYFEKILGMIGSKQVVYLKSAGLDFNYSNSSLTTIHGGSSMNGLALEFGVHGSAWTFLNPDKAARYVIAISNPAPAQPGELQLSIGNYSFRFSFGPGSSRFAYTQPIYLEPKRYSLIISKIRGDPSVDGVLAYSSSNNSTVDKLFNRGGSSKIVNFEEVSPTRYSITVDANKPFWLFLGETYDPDWVAYVGARQIRPVLSYQSVNGYLVNSTGKVHLTIEYVLQKFFDYGAAISFATLIVVLASIFVESRRIASNSRRPFG